MDYPLAPQCRSLLKKVETAQKEKGNVQPSDTPKKRKIDWFRVIIGIMLLQFVIRKLMHYLAG